MLAAVAFLALQPALRIDKDVPYRTLADGTKLLCDVYAPRESKGRRKAVAVFHGGAWVAGTRADMAAVCEMLAREGMTAITFDYRLAPKHKWPAMREDALYAIQWIREQERSLNLDTRQIGALGASAGGHLAMLTGYMPTAPGSKSSRTQVVFNLFGPTDMSQDFPPNMDPLYFIVLGKKRQEAAAEITEASPVTYIDRGDAPTVTIHGTSDPVVPFVQAERLQKALDKAHVAHEFFPIKGMGHEVNYNLSGVQDAVQSGIKFLKRYLRTR